VVEHTDRSDASPLASLAENADVAALVDEGPVRFLLVSGHQDDDAWGVVGALWLSIDGERGGVVVSPRALWLGSELARSYRSARRRGWSPEAIYRWWQTQVGAAGKLMIDPQQHAESLGLVYRRAGVR
jgi:hypothetical protein